MWAHRSDKPWQANNFVPKKQAFGILQKNLNICLLLFGGEAMTAEVERVRGRTCRGLRLEVTWQAAGNIVDGRQAGGTTGGQRGCRMHRGGRHGAQVRWIRLVIKPRRGRLWLPWVWPCVTKQRDGALFPQINPRVFCFFLHCVVTVYKIYTVCIRVIMLCLVSYYWCNSRCRLRWRALKSFC